MQVIDSIDELEALYETVVPGALKKVADHLTPLYRRWVEAARFLVLTTVGPEGTDASPRGDDGPVARVVDDRTLWLPDWRGNNRLDSLRNVVRDGRISLMFMVPGSNNVIRINGRAQLTADPAITASFEKAGKTPRTVIVVTLGEVYFQCAKALMRSNLWQGIEPADAVPSAGEFLSEVLPEVDAQAYDSSYGEYAKPRMW